MTRKSRPARFLAAVTGMLAVLAGLTPAPSMSADTGTMDAKTDRYIVVFKEAPLAQYRGGVADIPVPQMLPGKNRLDVKSVGARAYVDYLRQRQSETESKIGLALGRTLAVPMRMQHALNAIVTTLSPAEAEAVRKMPEVLLLDPVRDFPVDTDVGPALIGAPAIWNGSATGAAFPAQGEGMVIGVLDTGINFGSPSFAAVDPIDGYTHVNPLGAGNYLGTCAGVGVDVGRCNAKLIGGYDFVCGAPTNACTTAGLREEDGFGDTNGHGSHTASTVAGNRRDVVVAGNVRRIQGVAPRANVIAYDVCYTTISTGSGSCPNTASVGAVNQAIADGVVDAINFSIGGGAAPWTDSVSLAFLNATNAGIYVATSAGNSGPGANTMGHHEPWTASTAAATHGRAGWAYVVNVTGPGAVPPSLVGIALSEGANGVAQVAGLPGTTPLVTSPTYAGGSDGCAAFPAGTFAGAIAVLQRGTCSFTIKVNNAAAAGALVVLIANNAAGELIPSVPGATVPAYGILQASGTALVNWKSANPTATAAIPFPAPVVANVPDVIASFSSRGPAGNLDLLKPDMTAPGVNILAVLSGTTLTGSEQLTGLLSGTSMASPHNAGAALLLRQLKPAWTPPEVKSALEMTTTRSVLKEDGMTPATPFDMGGGRIRVDRAANAGLVMNETLANFQAADPALGGNPAGLNLPSFAKRSCVGECQFTRTLRSPIGTSMTWTATVTGLAGTVSPSSFTVPAGGSQAITVTIDSSMIPPDGAFRFGWVELQPQGGTADDKLTMPLAIAVPPALIALMPAAQDVAIFEGQTGSAAYSISNAGGFPLAYTISSTGQGATTIANADNTGVASGFRGTSYTDPATAGANAQLTADDFTITVPTTITSLFAQGFVVSGLALDAVATNITWAIYPDNGAGLPTGNPIQGPLGAEAWQYTASPTSAGVSTAGNNISLNLPAAGRSLTLAPGRYWVMIYTRSTFANRWAWYGSNGGSGGFASITVSTTNTGAWAANASFSGLALKVTGTVACGAPWIGATTPASGTLSGGAAQSMSTALSAVGLAAGTYTGTVCIASNDPVTPQAAETIRLTVSTPPAGTAARLAFTTAPSANVTAGVAFAQQPVVTVQDVANATVPGYATPVTLSVASGAGTVQCNANPVTPVGGVATFSGCRVNGIGTVTLRAASGAIPDSTTNPVVNVAAGPASQLAFTTQPGGGTGGTPWAGQPVVAVRDSVGNTVTGSAAPVTLAITTPAGATLACTANPLAATAGVATFAGCRIDKSGTYTLTATSAGLSPATSAAVTIQPLVLAVAKSGTGSGTVTSSPAGIDCGATCNGGFDVGTVVTLTATPAGGSSFAAWSDACTGTGACTVTMDVARSVTASFVLATGGIAPSPASLDFGGQSMNTTAPSQAVTLTNTGGASVTVSAVTASTHFAVTHNCATVAAGASCTANVAFTPTAEGSLNGTLTVQASLGNVTVPLAGEGERSLVTHYYRSILRRAPDGGGKAFWESEKVRLPGLGANVNETWYAMATFFYFSSEYQSFNRDDTGFISDLYNTFFNRPADGGGLTFWTGLLSQGMPREVVLVSFMFSTEFQAFTQAIFGNVQARKEVDTVVDFYRGLLSRLPDDGGFASWVGQFRLAQCAGAGAVYTTVEAISNAFANSGEYAARNRTNAQYVGDLYNAFLRRGGDLGGVQFWISQLAGGATRSAIRQQFIASPEFTSRVAAIIAQGCVLTP